MSTQQRIRFAAYAGIIGPLLLGSVITILTIAERNFMTSIGWTLRAPLDWPSGLALGPYPWMDHDADVRDQRTPDHYLRNRDFVSACRTTAW